MNTNSRSAAVAVGLAVVALVLAGASFLSDRSSTSAGPDTLARIQGRGRMIVCAATFPPAVSKNPETGAYTGHDVDFMALVADTLGVQLEFQDTTFGNMAAGIQSGQCDVGTSLFVKPARSLAVDFSDPIFFAGDAGLVRRGDTRFRSLADVNRPGVKVAVATGESGHLFAQEKLTNAQIVAIDVEAADLSRFMLEVTSGRADIAISDANTMALFARQHPETEMVFTNPPLQLSADALPLPKGDVKFQNFLNDTILTLQASGEWQAWEVKHDAHWFHPVQAFELR